MSRSKKPKPATVPFSAKQAGETQVQFPFGEENSRWTWVESSIWTDRMLTALEQGVKGGTWFSLIDKVYSLGNLQSAASEVARNGGVAGADRVTIEMFMDRKDANLERLSAALQTSLKKLKDAIRQKTKRTRGVSIRQIGREKRLRRKFLQVSLRTIIIRDDREVDGVLPASTYTVVVVPFDDSFDTPLTIGPNGHVSLPATLGALDSIGALGGGTLNGDQGDYTLRIAYQAATYDRGDFNMNGVINAADIDLLAANDGNITDSKFDLNGDGIATYSIGGQRFGFAGARYYRHRIRRCQSGRQGQQ